MKKGMKKAISILMVIIITLSVAPAGAFTANAADIDYLTYKIENGEVTITDCSTEATGEITIPDEIDGAKVTNIGGLAFYNCSSLQVVNLPESIVSIGERSFKDCVSLEVINLPESLVSIDERAFEKCTSLQNVEFPETVTSIGKKAFYQCTNLQSVTIPQGVKQISNQVFQECRSLQSVILPDMLTSIGYSSFAYCSFEEIDIPDTVTYIGQNAFERCERLKSVKIPDGVTEICSSTFYYCSSLQNVELPDTVTSIENDAFGYCAFSEFIIPDAVTSIGSGAFRNCSNLLEIKIPEGITQIGDNTFYSCYSLQEITLPKALISIGGSVFFQCRSLQNIEIPKTVTDIGEWAFFECNNLHSINIPAGVTQISDYLFYGCSSLQSIVLPETITSVGPYAFFNNVSLTDVFYYGSEEQWQNISVSSNNEKLTSAVVHFDYLPNTGSCGESVTWNYYEDTKTLAVVGGGAMYDYDSPEDCEWYDLKNNIELVTVSGKVESVGENAFNGYPNLKEFYLGSSTQKVGENAFDNCPNLSLVSSTASTLIIGANAFEGCNDRIKFVCYSANDGLLEFANEDDLIKVSFDPEQKALKFNGELTVYPDLNYEFLNRFLMNNNGAEYIFFSKLIFHGVEPDIVDVEDLENDASAQYLTFTNLYISIRAVKNGAQENITFGEMLELLEGGDYDAFIFDLNSDESNQEVTVPSWKKTIDNFIEDVVKAVSKLINFVAKLFRRK